VMSDVAEALASAGGGGTKKDFPPARKVREFDGQVVTVVSIKQFPGGKFGTSVLATILDAEENAYDVWQTGVSGRQLIAIEGTLPQDLKVESFDTDFGNRGYKYVPA
jgi:hypothetical protein